MIGEAKGPWHHLLASFLMRNTLIREWANSHRRNLHLLAIKRDFNLPEMTLSYVFGS